MPVPQISNDVVFGHVQEAIRLALGVDSQEVTPRALLIEELGAESLDFLDIAFRLERFFEVKLPRRNIIDRAAEVFGEDVFADDDGTLTEAGLKLVRLRLPEADPSRIKPGMTASDIATLLTAETWVRTVQEVFESVPERCPACSGEVTLRDSIKFACAGCGERVYPPSSDELYSIWLERAHKDGMFQ